MNDLTILKNYIEFNNSFKKSGFNSRSFFVRANEYIYESETTT